MILIWKIILIDLVEVLFRPKSSRSFHLILIIDQDQFFGDLPELCHNLHCNLLFHLSLPSDILNDNTLTLCGKYGAGRGLLPPPQSVRVEPDLPQQGLHVRPHLAPLGGRGSRLGVDLAAVEGRAQELGRTLNDIFMLLIRFLNFILLSGKEQNL